MTRTPMLALAFLAVMLVGVWALTRAGDASTGIIGPPGVHVAPDDALPVIAMPPPETSSPRQRIEPDAPETAPPEPTLAVEVLERPDLVTLNGATIRVDARGDEHGGDSGGFRVQWRRGAETGKRDVEVLGGTWSVEVPPDVELYVHRLVLAGIPVALERDQFAVPTDLFLMLRGTERRGVSLRVLSAVDGIALDDVEVWPGPYAFPTNRQHPGAEPNGEAIVRDASSPVLIPAPADGWRSASQYFVRAPGHAWGSVVIDHASSGERELVLQPESALEVELIGSADWLQPVIRLRLPDASPAEAYAFAELQPDADDRAVFEALPAGTYRVSVERGWARRRISYGSATITTLAGERSTLPITVELPERPTAVDVSGTLTVPAGWDRAGMQLAFGGAGDTSKWLTEELAIPLGDMRKLGQAPEAMEQYAWEVELPMAGSYRLEVFPLMVRQLLVVPEGGLAAVDVVVPLPADVEVRVLDATTGEEIPVDMLNWSTAHIEGIVGTPLYSAVLDGELGCVTFRAPAGDITVHTAGMTLMPVDRNGRFHVEPGKNRIELRVDRQIGVRFTFIDGDATIPWDWSWRLSAHRTDGTARDEARSIGALWFQEEGTFELRSKGIPGFQSIDGTRFEVVTGQGMIHVEVQLVRE